MAGPDPSAGFVKDDVVASLRAAMVMGLPNDPAMRPIFHFPKTVTAGTPADDAGHPFDYAAAPATVAQRPDVTSGAGANQVACAWVGAGGRGGTASNETPFGDFDVERLTLYVLDADYPKIEGFTSVTLGGDEYVYTFEGPVQGLWDMDLYAFSLQAVDES